MRDRTRYFTDLAEECERLAVADGTTPAEAVRLWRRAAYAWGEAPLCEGNAKLRRAYRDRSLRCLQLAVQSERGQL